VGLGEGADISIMHLEVFLSFESSICIFIFSGVFEMNREAAPAMLFLYRDLCVRNKRDDICSDRRKPLGDFYYVVFSIVFFTIGNRVPDRTEKSTIIPFRFHLHNVQIGSEPALSIAMIFITYIFV